MPLVIPSNRRLLWRGLRKKCPICGGGRLFTRWVGMKDRCPTCGYLFAREDGFFLGAYVVNFAFMEGSLGLFMIAAFAMTVPDPPTVTLAALGCVVAVLAPIFFYPFSKTIWTAIDVAMHRNTADAVGHNRFEANTSLTPAPRYPRPPTEDDDRNVHRGGAQDAVRGGTPDGQPSAR
jgi:uncharacterized protein (DUF983 family)